MNVGSINKNNYQSSHGGAGQSGQPNSSHGKSNSHGAGGNALHKNIMSHRVSYDQYGSAGGILGHDLSTGPSHHPGSGQQISSNTGRYAHISMSGGAIGGSNLQHANNHNRNHQSSSYAGRITGQAVVNGQTSGAH